MQEPSGFSCRAVCKCTVCHPVPTTRTQRSAFLDPPQSLTVQETQSPSLYPTERYNHSFDGFTNSAGRPKPQPPKGTHTPRHVAAPVHPSCASTPWKSREPQQGYHLEESRATPDIRTFQFGAGLTNARCAPPCAYTRTQGATFLDLQSLRKSGTPIAATYPAGGYNHSL
jgi:hypothetical protein